MAVAIGASVARDVGVDRIICADNLQALPQISDESIQMVLTSPPYGTVRNGGYDPYSMEQFYSLKRELFRILCQGGVIVWVVGDQVIGGSETGTPFKQALAFMEEGFLLHDTMIWVKPNPLPTNDGNRYTNAFEFMFVLSKGSPRVANLLTEKSIYAGAILSARQWKEGRWRPANGNGRAVNEFKTRTNVFSYGVGAEKTGHPAVFPLKLAHEQIRTWSNPGDTVLDPFNGSGTTTLSAQQLGRNWIGIDSDEEYCEIARKRMRQQVLLAH